MIKLDINIGDTILVGRFKNKRIEVKEFGIDEHGGPTINGKSILKIRIEKLMKTKKNLKESTMTLKELEDYFYENESDIRDNMKTYGFKLKDVSKIRNYIDFATLLGVDSRDVKDIDLSQYTDTLTDLLIAEQHESKQFKMADVVKKILNESPDINDPRLMALRAKKDQIQSYGRKPTNSEVNRWYDVIDKLYDRLQEIAELEKETFSEMESDPDIELAGGTVADKYGDALNKLDILKQKVLSKIKEYNDKINKYKEVFLKR